MNAIASLTNRSLRLPVIAGVLLSTVLGLTGAKASEDAVLAKTQPANPAAKEAGSDKEIPKKKPHRWFQFGGASWYGGKFQGRSTASGESYDPNGMTCAHRSLPLGTLLKVTNLRNHKSVVVRVNDRGPVPEDRVVDLSYAAAQTLGFLGVAKVRIDLLTKRDVAQLSWPQRLDLLPQQ